MSEGASRLQWQVRVPLLCSAFAPVSSAATFHFESTFSSIENREEELVRGHTMKSFRQFSELRFRFALGLSGFYDARIIPPQPAQHIRQDRPAMVVGMRAFAEFVLHVITLFLEGRDHRLVLLEPIAELIL